MVHLVSAGTGEILTLKARVSLLVLYSNFIGVKWEKEALVPRVGRWSLAAGPLDRPDRTGQAVVSLLAFWPFERDFSRLYIYTILLTNWILICLGRFALDPNLESKSKIPPQPHILPGNLI